ncbi:MAG: hypothetical protein IKD53_08115, partial [Clostridia bacterium]|nr:hypothetical protein [Clostridia bacterium]
MRKLAHSALRRAMVCALAMAMVLAMPAFGELATDLNGRLEAADPAVVEAMDTEQAAPAIDMTTADVVIGYIAPEMSSIHPAYCVEWSLVSLNQLVFESVVDLDENLKPAPMLADSWEQDGKTWTFKLRSGIQFHNGVELTAYDVVRSYETIVTSYADTPYYGRLQAIDHMEAADIDSLTVVGKNSGLS